MKKSIILSIYVLLSYALFGQTQQFIKGRITDATTGEGLPFATVSYVGNESVGTTTDFDGFFELSTNEGTDSIQAAFLGYQAQTVAISKISQNQTINFVLTEEQFTLVTAEVKAKKVRYRRKDNPAVELIKKVMVHKNKNRLEGQDYAEYDQYEKVELGINNVNEDYQKKKIFKKVQFLFDYVDTSEINGAPYLPIYLKETASKVYYQKAPQKEKQYVEGVKTSGSDAFLLTQNISTLTNYLYQDIDVYNNNIWLFGKSFISPLNTNVGNAFYRYYILDTMAYNGIEVINLAFMPNNKQDIGFEGNLYITNDENYALVKANLGLTSKANINWVNNLQLCQEFKPYENFWILSKDEILADFTLMEGADGFSGSRKVQYQHHQFNQPKPATFYSGKTNTITSENAQKRAPDFWETARQEPLTVQEQRIYKMIDTLQTVSAFKNTLNVISTLTSGYWKFDKVELGPVGAFYSFNDVEGFRLRLGGGTTMNFNPKIKLEGYAAYGVKDEELKYAGSILYSFNERYQDNPKHYLKASYQHETSFAGQDLKFVVEDNFFLSFKRGNTARMLMLDAAKLNYRLETRMDWAFGLNFTHQKQAPLGSISFDTFDPENLNPQLRTDITTTELEGVIRWAPNEQYVQGHSRKIPIYNKYPVFNLRYAQGFKDVLGGEFDYQRVSIDVFKRFYFSPIGMTDVFLEAGKIWGDGIPYFSLLIPRGNQTFAYQDAAFNMMNFLEFTNDQFVSWNIQHYFNGFIFNRIPLFRRLKWREVITFKGVWGSLRDANNPNLDPSLIQFTTSPNGGLETFTLSDKPYMEVSAGIANIFKFGRIDLVKRLNYLNQPNVPTMFGTKGLGIRFMVKFEF